MLRITIPSIELFDEKSNRFSKTKEVSLQMEHSLVSISKWESKWRKPFLSKVNKTREETLDYFFCMTISQNIDPKIFNYIPSEVVDQIMKYIETPRTATIVPEVQGSPPNREIITSELIYYWMVTFNIPFECQTWHLDRLLTLIKVINLKNQPKKKGNKRDIMSRNSALNAKRKAELKTTG